MMGMHTAAGGLSPPVITHTLGAGSKAQRACPTLPTSKAAAATQASTAGRPPKRTDCAAGAPAHCMTACRPQSPPQEGHTRVRASNRSTTREQGDAGNQLQHAAGVWGYQLADDTPTQLGTHCGCALEGGWGWACLASASHQCMGLASIWQQEHDWSTPAHMQPACMHPCAQLRCNPPAMCVCVPCVSRW